MSEREQERKRQRRRRAFHVAIAVILVICALAPFVELAANRNDSVFATGYDGESTLAVLALLLELVISLAGLLVCRCNLQLGERVVLSLSGLTPGTGFHVTISELASPPPLRI